MSLVDRCELANICSGCQWISEPYPRQLERKRQALLEAWKGAGLPLEWGETFQIRSIDRGFLRDRVDLLLKSENGVPKLGLYDVGRSNVVDIRACPQMSPALESWFQEFRGSLPRIPIGSVRLRISPRGVRGVWLDLPNVEVKNLLDEGQWLRALAEKAIVEIGQKRKRLIEKEGRLKLGDPQFEPWFETYSGKSETPIPLYIPVGGFSQPGFRANKALVHELHQLLKMTTAKTWVELCSGSGNLTLSLASSGKQVDAIELDFLAPQGLLRSALEAGLEDHVHVEAADIHRPSEKLEAALRGKEGILADPPRSGLGTFLDILERIPTSTRPRSFISVSCFLESFVSDSKKLIDMGYGIRACTGVDQFPQSPHCEYLALFELDR